MKIEFLEPDPIKYAGCNYQYVLKISYGNDYTTSALTKDDMDINVVDFTKHIVEPLFNRLIERQMVGNKEHKMTREEAIQKTKENMHYDSQYDRNVFTNAREFVNVLEALGLLKFSGWPDEPVKPSAEKGKYIFFPHPDGEHKMNVSVLQTDAIETMQSYGYKVEHKSKPVEPSSVEKGLTLAIGSVGYGRVKKWLTNYGYEIVKTKPDAQFAADSYPIEGSLPVAIAMLKRLGYEVYRKDGTKA